MLNSENNFLKVCCILLLMAILEQASAQDVLLKEEEDGWIPGMLQTKNSAYFQLLQFNGYGIGWKYRGFENSSTLTINGIEWNSKKLGVDLNAAMFGIHTLSRTEKITTGFVPTENGLAASPVMRYVNMNASDFSKNITISNRFQPLTGSFQTNFIWSTGRLKKSWYAQLKLQHEQSFIQNPALGKRALKGFVFNMHKSFTKHQYLNINFWYNHRYQTKQSPSVKEVLKLSENELYQPGWGWLDGEMVFPNAKTSNLPIVQVQYSRKINERHRFQVNWALVKGIQSVDGLDWTSVKDPRPDYYKYLPSYYQDSALRALMHDNLLQNPGKGQIDWMGLYSLNALSNEPVIMGSNPNLILQKRAAVIVENRIDKQQTIAASMVYHSPIGKAGLLHAGINAQLEQHHFYKKVHDLLGAHYYVNINQFAEDALQIRTDVNQFDIENPNQIILQNQNFGYNYKALLMQTAAYLQSSWAFARFDIFAGVQFTGNSFKRVGLVKNGLFPLQSKGTSYTYHFTSPEAKLGVTYKLNGRHYFSVELLSAARAPLFDNVFVAPKMRSTVTDHISSEKISSVLLGYQYQQQIE